MLLQDLGVIIDLISYLLPQMHFRLEGIEQMLQLISCIFEFTVLVDYSGQFESVLDFYVKEELLCMAEVVGV
jgi:hypothetical protein